jgi:hypothetical protein
MALGSVLVYVGQMVKTYRDAQLGELVHSIAVEHVSEYEVVCGSKPVGEKCEEGETATEW